MLLDSQGDGAWIAKWTDEEGKRRLHALGTFQDTPTCRPTIKPVSPRRHGRTSAARRDPQGRDRRRRVQTLRENFVAEVGDLNANDAEVRFSTGVQQTDRPEGLVEIPQRGHRTLAQRPDPEVGQGGGDAEGEGHRKPTFSALKAALNYAFHNKLIGNDSDMADRQGLRKGGASA